MDLSNLSIKKIRELIVFTALLVIALWKFDVVLDVLKTIWQIVFPFILGGAIVFAINVPMSFLEKKIFENVKKKISSEKTGKTGQSASHDRIGGWRDRIGDDWCDSSAYEDNGNFDDKYHRFYSAD